MSAANPLSLAINGASGRLGQSLLKMLSSDSSWRLVAAWVGPDDSLCGQETGVGGVVYSSLKNGLLQGQSKPQVVVDFSSLAAIETLVEKVVTLGVPLVSGTTGLSEKEFATLEKASQAIPVLWAPNFSLTVFLWQDFLRRLALVHSTGWQAHIEETHREGKKDAPSGTAIALAQSLLSDCPDSQAQSVTGRELQALSDDAFALGPVSIKSIRCGQVAGIHVLHFSAPGESLCMQHEADGPELFAHGALQVARWLSHQLPGKYTLADYLQAIAPVNLT